jgi:hypothetical protein
MSSSRRERDRARALANGEAFDGSERNIGLGCKSLAKRFVQAGAHWASLRLAGDADEQRRGDGGAAMRVHSATLPVRSSGLGPKLEVWRAVMYAPWPPLRRPYGIYGARQVSWLAAYRRRRLPRPMKSPVARKASARRLQSRGRPRIGENLPCSLFTLGRNRGTVRWSCSSFERGCQIEH